MKGKIGIIKMKKIICLLLALTCCFAFFACKDDEEPEITADDVFLQVVRDSAPTKIKTMSTYAHKATDTVYNGTYVTTMTADGFVFDYEYQQKALVKPGASLDGSVETVAGQVVYANGKYSTDGGETWKGEAPDTGALNITLNITKENLGSYTLSKDGKTITTVINSELAAKLLGLNIASDEISVKISTNGKYLTEISIEYATDKAEYTVVTSYAYTVVEAPSEETPAE